MKDYGEFKFLLRKNLESNTPEKPGKNRSSGPGARKSLNRKAQDYEQFNEH